MGAEKRAGVLRFRHLVSHWRWGAGRLQYKERKIARGWISWNTWRSIKSSLVNFWTEGYPIRGRVARQSQAAALVARPGTASAKSNCDSEAEAIVARGRREHGVEVLVAVSGG